MNQEKREKRRQRPVRGGVSRLLSLVCAAALVLSLTGCSGGNSPESLYKGAAKAWREADRVALDLTMVSSVSQNGGSVQNNLEGSLYRLGKNGETPTLYLNGKMDLDLGTGSPMSIPLSYVYWEGCLYADLAGVRYRQNRTPEQVEAQAYQGLAIWEQMEAEDFRNLSLQEGSSSQTLTFGIGAEEVRLLAENLPQIRAYQEAYGEGLTMRFTDAEGTLALDEDGNPARLSVQLSAELSAEGFAASVSFQITEEYRAFGEEVDVTLPDLSGYELLGEDTSGGSGSSGEESQEAPSESETGNESGAGGESSAS